MDTVEIESFQGSSWNAAFTRDQQEEALRVLEDGGLLFFPQLGFPICESEQTTLAPDSLRRGAKNISYDLRTATLHGCALPAGRAHALQRMMERYARKALGLVQVLFPHYAPVLEPARTTYRPVEASGRAISWRKDDRRLHVDAFPSSPTQGRRLLRVFSNIHPGRDRVWHIGEPFESVARRFLPATTRPWPGSARLLHGLGITKSRRTEYDHIMLQIHDRMKADDDYQHAAVRAEVSLPSGSSWITQTDCISHAAISGQSLLEQTFLLPVESMRDPHKAPLRVLERLAGRALI